MKKILSLLTLIFLVSFLACKDNENKNSQTENTAASQDSLKVEYTCPMHPEVLSDKPGTCPTCGMDLEAKS